MRLRELAVVLTLSLLAAGAQLGEQVYRIGLLSEGAHPLFRLADAWRELGWIEDKNLKFERRRRLKVDLILTNGTQAAGVAKEATKAPPIVSCDTRTRSS